MRNRLQDRPEEASRRYDQDQFNAMQRVWWDTYVVLHTGSPVGKVQ